ncbi:MAG: iron hydrogenase [Patescibacteria group bacterium]
MKIQTKAIPIGKEKIIAAVKFATLLAIVVLAPAIGQQAITGSIVNAVLFISAATLGVESAILIGLIPSLISLSVGLLPAILAPMVPFIMVGNTILILTFNFLRKKNYWIGVVTASILKFAFLFGVSSIVVDLLLKKEIAANVAAMMSWPQLLTALAGGLIAYIFLKAAKNI